MDKEFTPYNLTLYDYNDVPTIKKFAQDNTRMRCIMGPFGCLRGDSLIVTEQGLVPISDIIYPVHVLSWDENSQKFVFSLSGGAFPKGKDCLYQVSTQQGKFVAAGHHLVFCGDGKYQQVQNLQQGDSLPLCSSVHLLKSIAKNQFLSLLNVHHFWKRFSSWSDSYAMLIRQYGQQLLKAINTFQVSSPELNDAHILSCPADFSSVLQKDGLMERLLRHNRLNQFSCQKQTDDLNYGNEHRPQAGQVHTYKQPFLHNGEKDQQSLQFLLKFSLHHIKRLLSLCFYSYSSSISNRVILQIKRLDVKEIYWDMQVLNTNNYVTSDGTIHHNSGKTSGCITEIIHRANQQPPSSDGIRRSRWAVIRNTYNQLKDTTIRTFHEWYPPTIFGEYHVTDHNFFITKFPGVHLEICFRALDREDQVSNLLSFEFTSAYFNEVREIPWSIIDAMDGRIGRYPKKDTVGEFWHGIIMDTNPPDEDSTLYKIAEKIRPDNFKMFKQPSGLSIYAENTKHLAKNYYKNLAKGKDEMFTRVYIHGQYGYLVSGKPVFQSFRDNIHVAPRPLEPMKGLDVLIGLDFGLQPACTIGQITPLGQLRILDELVSDGMGIRQFSLNQLLPLLRQKYFGMNVMGYGDMHGSTRAQSDESTCFDILHSSEIGLSNIIPAPTNALVPRIGAVESFLNKMNMGEPGFVLSPNCHFLRKAMNGAYHYDKDPKGSGEEYKPVPVKNFASHISDSLEYLCMYLAEKEIYDKQRRSFLAQLKQKDYRPACSEAGY